MSLPSGPAAIRQSGAGPALLCLHGAPGSSWDFRWIGGAAGERMRVIRLDRPGFGDTPLDTGPALSAADFADFAVAVLDALGIERAVVMGHSLGCGAAIELAARHPARCLGLALVSSPGLRPHKAFRRGRVQGLGRLLDRPLAGRLLRPLVLPLFRLAGFPARVSLDEALHTLRCAAAFHFSEQRAQLAALSPTLPTLLTASADDPLIEPAITDELSEALPPGPRLRWGDGGHNPQKPYAAEIVEAVLGMLG